VGRDVFWGHEVMMDIDDSKAGICRQHRPATLMEGLIGWDQVSARKGSEGCNKLSPSEVVELSLMHLHKLTSHRNCIRHVHQIE